MTHALNDIKGGNKKKRRGEGKKRKKGREGEKEKKKGKGGRTGLRRI